MDGTLESWIRLLGHDAWRVRYHAAEALISVSRFVRTDRSSAEQLARQLRPMLSDPSEEVVGVTGETEVRGRLFHWRSQRRSLSEVAIHASLAIEAELSGSEVLEAMIAQSTRAIVRCGNTALTPHYCVSQWRRACEAAGGIPACEPKIRAARQRCHERWHSGDAQDVALLSAESELARVVEHLSGRRIPYPEWEF